MHTLLNYRRYHLLPLLLALVGLAVVALIGFSVMYAGKIYPGVSVDGLYVGGLSQEKAVQQIHTQAESYATEQLPVQYGRTTLHIPLNALGATYNDATAQSALKFGRSGSLTHRIGDRVKAMLGRSTSYAAVTYDDSKLTPFIDQVDGDTATSVANAALTFRDGAVAVTPSQPGGRLDRGRLTLAITDRVATMSTKTVEAPTYTITPTITAATLAAASHQADGYATSPLKVSVAEVSQTIDEAKILSWIDVTTPAGRTDLPIDPLYQFYDSFAAPAINLALNQQKVEAYVATLAASINQDPKNAVLAMQDGVLKVVAASQTGKSLDQPAAVQEIMKTIKTSDVRDVKLTAKVTAAEVNENNLDSLGIKEQLSEGQTFFPGSTAARMQNVRVGAAKYNDVLLKPGEVFSFGKILGDVGPAQGYLPELVILGDHEEKQYGGGLCQVASTAYRAALLAGLPILERHNHSFAVSYYTAPYGVPGVDATIYYPQVDFKFKNDTPGYLLIQTVMQGTTLRFDYFGTKTKTGEIRGPEFISGSTDAKQPSRTVFYRDIKDLNGNVTKTDAVYTNYQPSTDFPITQQFN